MSVSVSESVSTSIFGAVAASAATGAAFLVWASSALYLASQSTASCCPGSCVKWGVILGARHVLQTLKQFQFLVWVQPGCVQTHGYMSNSVNFPLVLSFLFLPVWSDSDHCHSTCLFHGMMAYKAPHNALLVDDDAGLLLQRYVCRAVMSSRCDNLDATM